MRSLRLHLTTLSGWHYGEGWRNKDEILTTTLRNAFRMTFLWDPHDSVALRAGWHFYEMSPLRSEWRIRIRSLRLHFVPLRMTFLWDPYDYATQRFQNDILMRCLHFGRHDGQGLDPYDYATLRSGWHYGEGWHCWLDSSTPSSFAEISPLRYTSVEMTVVLVGMT